MNARQLHAELCQFERDRTHQRDLFFCDRFALRHALAYVPLALRQEVERHLDRIDRLQVESNQLTERFLARLIAAFLLKSASEEVLVRRLSERQSPLWDMIQKGSES